MAITRHLRPVVAGLVLSVAATVPSLAQEPTTPPTPPPPDAGVAVPLQTTDVVTDAPGPMLPSVAGAPTAPEAVSGCSCGERRGMSRWWWHRIRCKRHLQEKFLGYPEEFDEWPLGMALTGNMRPQVANAEAASMTFYHYDFVAETAQLNQRGRDKLARVAGLVAINFCPVIVERTVDTPALDQGRRRAVLEALSAGSFPVPPERVVIGPALARGMDGTESLVVYRNLLQNTAAGGYLGGANPPVGGGAGSASDALGITGAAAPPR